MTTTTSYEHQGFFYRDQAGYLLAAGQRVQADVSSDRDTSFVEVFTAEGAEEDTFRFFTDEADHNTAAAGLNRMSGGEGIVVDVTCETVIEADTDVSGGTETPTEVSTGPVVSDDTVPERHPAENASAGEGGAVEVMVHVDTLSADGSEAPRQDTGETQQVETVVTSCFTGPGEVLDDDVPVRYPSEPEPQTTGPIVSDDTVLPRHADAEAAVQDVYIPLNMADLTGDDFLFL